MRSIDLLKEKERIIGFIGDYVTGAKKENVILGLSGGIDSAVIAALSVAALGKENVYAIILPYRTSNPLNVQDADKLAGQLGIHQRTIDITPYVDTYYETNAPEASILRKGNFMARIRMCILYDLSVEQDALVIGTGNRTELLTGYTTQYGDNACAFEPIGHLYKTEVRKLASLLNIPEDIISKKPSADLWEGQTDEDEIGLSYEKLDEILHLMFDQRKDIEEIISNGFHKEEVKLVNGLYKGSEFKRRLPQLIDDL